MRKGSAASLYSLPPFRETRTASVRGGARGASQTSVARDERGGDRSGVVTEAAHEAAAGGGKVGAVN